MVVARPTRRTMLVVVLAVVSLMVIGCAAKTTSAGISPEKLGRIGAEINQNPDQMSQILSEHDLSEEEFEKAVREVSSDAEMSRRYHEAFQEASDT